MAERKKMSDTARKFIETGQIEPTASSVVNQEESSNEALRRELLGEEKALEPTVRFTVDLPKSLHRRLDQLSLDSSKPKTELVRVMIRQSLEQIGY